MDITFADLEKMPLTKLKEYALTVGNIHGVHSMKKNQLLEEICKIKGLVDSRKEALEKKRLEARKEIGAVKTELKKMRVDRNAKRDNLSRKERGETRKEIKVLKRKTRKLAKI